MGIDLVETGLSGAPAEDKVEESKPEQPKKKKGRAPKGSNRIMVGRPNMPMGVPCHAEGKCYHFKSDKHGEVEVPGWAVPQVMDLGFKLRH